MHCLASILKTTAPFNAKVSFWRRVRPRAANSHLRASRSHLLCGSILKKLAPSSFSAKLTWPAGTSSLPRQPSLMFARQIHALRTRGIFVGTSHGRRATRGPQQRCSSPLIKPLGPTGSQPVLCWKAMYAKGCLEHFRIYCRPLKQSLNHAFALSAVMSFKESAIVCSRASLVLAWAERSNCLSFAQAFSMGFRSGE